MPDRPSQVDFRRLASNSVQFGRMSIPNPVNAAMRAHACSVQAGTVLMASLLAGGKLNTTTHRRQVLSAAEEAQGARTRGGAVLSAANPPPLLVQGPQAPSSHPQTRCLACHPSQLLERHTAVLQCVAQQSASPLLHGAPWALPVLIRVRCQLHSQARAQLQGGRPSKPPSQ